MADNILTALQFLEAALSQENKKAIIFMDEVQEINQIESSAEIQGAIRHFAQKTSTLVFIFSGSNRRMLRHMFGDSIMPLYQLCDSITLGKIPESTYVSYFQKVSKIAWNKVIADEVIAEIIKLSQRHPRRVYNLCLYLWRLADIYNKTPTVKSVQEAWHKLINTEVKGIRYYLSQKNTSQLKTLAYIALGGKTELTGKAGQMATNLSGPAISKALQQLEQDDVLERYEDGSYHIIDPIIKDIISSYESDLID